MSATPLSQNSNVASLLRGWADQVERDLKNTDYRAGYFAQSYKVLAQKIEREAPHLLTLSDRQALNYAIHCTTGAPVNLALVVDSEDFPSPGRG